MLRKYGVSMFNIGLISNKYKFYNLLFMNDKVFIN